MVALDHPMMAIAVGVGTARINRTVWMLGYPAIDSGEVLVVVRFLLLSG